MATSIVYRKENESTPKTGSRLPLFAAILLLSLMSLLAGGAALRESVTFDEVAHISAGVSYWQKLDMRLNEEHPPLAKLMAALPLAVQRTRADYTHPSWTLSTDFFTAYAGQWVFGEYLLKRWNDPVRILAWARFPMLLITVALGWVIFALGRRLGGPWGGVLALCAFATAPVFLAFGPLVLTDIPITLFSILSLWTFAELLQEPSRKNIMLFGGSFAGALLSKFSAGMLLFAFAGVVLSTRWWPVAQQSETVAERKLQSRRRRWAFLKALLWAAVIVYVVYLAFSWNQPLPQIFHGRAGTIFGRLLMPPLLYLRGMFMVVITGNRPAFLLGQTYPHGVWFYFPVLFFLKSSLGFLGLTVLVASLSLVPAKSKTAESVIPAEARMHWRVIWVSLIVFAALCILSHLNVCYRHFSIPVVLMTLMLAPLPIMLRRLRVRAPRLGTAAVALTVLLAAGCVLTAMRQYPYFTPYASPLTLGRPAYTLMSDANIDWNQSLPEVSRFAQQHHLQRVKIDEYGFTETTSSVPGSELWDCQKPAAEDADQWVVVSANMIADIHNCKWLMQYPFEPLAAGSMYAVHLPPVIPEPGSPGGPPTANETRMFFGMAGRDMRSMFRDLVRDPNSLSGLVSEMQAEYRRQQEEQKKRKQSSGK